MRLYIVSVRAGQIRASLQVEHLPQRCALWRQPRATHPAEAEETSPWVNSTDRAREIETTGAIRVAQAADSSDVLALSAR